MATTVLYPIPSIEVPTVTPTPSAATVTIDPAAQSPAQFELLRQSVRFLNSGGEFAADWNIIPTVTSDKLAVVSRRDGGGNIAVVNYRTGEIRTDKTLVTPTAAVTAIRKPVLLSSSGTTVTGTNVNFNNINVGDILCFGAQRVTVQSKQSSTQITTDVALSPAMTAQPAVGFLRAVAGQTFSTRGIVTIKVRAGTSNVERTRAVTDGGLVKGGLTGVGSDATVSGLNAGDTLHPKSYAYANRPVGEGGTGTLAIEPWYIQRQEIPFRVESVYGSFQDLVSIAMFQFNKTIIVEGDVCVPGDDDYDASVPTPRTLITTALGWSWMTRGALSVGGSDPTGRISSILSQNWSPTPICPEFHNLKIVGVWSSVRGYSPYRFIDCAFDHIGAVASLTQVDDTHAYVDPTVSESELVLREDVRSKVYRCKVSNFIVGLSICGNTGLIIDSCQIGPALPLADWPSGTPPATFAPLQLWGSTNLNAFEGNVWNAYVTSPHGMRFVQITNNVFCGTGVALEDQNDYESVSILAVDGNTSNCFFSSNTVKDMKIFVSDNGAINLMSWGFGSCKIQNCQCVDNTVSNVNAPAAFVGSAAALIDPFGADPGSEDCVIAGNVFDTLRDCATNPVILTSNLVTDQRHAIFENDYRDSGCVDKGGIAVGFSNGLIKETGRWPVGGGGTKNWILMLEGATNDRIIGMSAKGNTTPGIGERLTLLHARVQNIIDTSKASVAQMMASETPEE